MSNFRTDDHYPIDNKRGYLRGDFAFFHLKDMKNMQFEYHYHDFNKIIVFISGNVTYLIEGKAYRLRPWDILFISSNEVHRPAIDPSFPYERIVIWINPGFLQKHSSESDLFTCFRLACERNSNLLRLSQSLLKDTQFLLYKLEEACGAAGFGSVILKNSIFLHLLVILTRERVKTIDEAESKDVITDEVIQKVLEYIGSNMDKDLTIDALSVKFFLSRYYLMHKFKQQTGCSIHSYILQKRLLKADGLIKTGAPAAQASEQCGFNDYSSFTRAYKKLFGQSPKKRIKEQPYSPSSNQPGEHISDTHDNGD